MEFIDPGLMSGASVVVGAILSILIGLLFCFFGYRIFKVILAIAGFIFGFSLVSFIASQLTAVPWIVIVGGIAGGLLFAVLAVALFVVGLFILGAYFGAIIGLFVWTSISIPLPSWLLMVILAVIGGVLAILLKRLMIIVSTSFIGAWSIVTGVFMFIPSETGEILMWIKLAIWVSLGVLGMIVQYMVTAKKKIEEDRKKEE